MVKILGLSRAASKRVAVLFSLAVLAMTSAVSTAHAQVTLPTDTDLGFAITDYIEAGLLKFGGWYGVVVGIFFLAALITMIKFRARNAISHAK